MTFERRTSGRFAVAIAALALGLLAAAPAGGWPDPDPGRPDGVSAGSAPSQAAQVFLNDRAARRATVTKRPHRTWPRAGECRRPQAVGTKAAQKRAERPACRTSMRVASHRSR